MVNYIRISISSGRLIAEFTDTAFTAAAGTGIKMGIAVAGLVLG